MVLESCNSSQTCSAVITLPSRITSQESFWSSSSSRPRIVRRSDRSTPPATALRKSLKTLVFLTKLRMLPTVVMRRTQNFGTSSRLPTRLSRPLKPPKGALITLIGIELARSEADLLLLSLANSSKLTSDQTNLASSRVTAIKHTNYHLTVQIMQDYILFQKFARFTPNQFRTYKKPFVLFCASYLIICLYYLFRHLLTLSINQNQCKSLI